MSAAETKKATAATSETIAEPFHEAMRSYEGSGANIIKYMFLSGEKASQILGGQDHGPNFRSGGCFSG